MTMTLERGAIEAAEQRKEIEVADLIGPYVPPSADEILTQVDAHPESRAEVLHALGEAAVAIHTEALVLSQCLQKETTDLIKVIVPGSVVDRRIVDEATVYAMNQNSKLAGRRLPRVSGSSVLRTMVEI